MDPDSSVQSSEIMPESMLVEAVEILGTNDLEGVSTPHEDADLVEYQTT